MCGTGPARPKNGSLGTRRNRARAPVPRYIVAESTGYPIRGTASLGPWTSWRETEVLVLDTADAHRVVASFIGRPEPGHRDRPVRRPAGAARLAAKACVRRLEAGGWSPGKTRWELLRLRRLGVTRAFVVRAVGITEREYDTMIARERARQ